MHFDLKLSQKIFWGQYFMKQSLKCVPQIVNKVQFGFSAPKCQLEGITSNCSPYPLLFLCPILRVLSTIDNDLVFVSRLLAIGTHTYFFQPKTRKLKMPLY